MIFPTLPSGDSDFSEIYSTTATVVFSGVAAAIDRYGLAEFPKLSAEEHDIENWGPLSQLPGGGNSNIFNFQPEMWGNDSHFDEHIF